MPLYIAQSGDLDRCHRCLTDRLTTLKDRATQLLIKCKSGALVTQLTGKKSYGYWPALPSNIRKMRCIYQVGGVGATSPCWLLSADRELEAWIGFATFRRNWHGLCRHEYRANCRQREALQKSDTIV